MLKYPPPQVQETNPRSTLSGVQAGAEKNHQRKNNEQGFDDSLCVLLFLAAYTSLRVYLGPLS